MPDLTSTAGRSVPLRADSRVDRVDAVVVSPDGSPQATIPTGRLSERSGSDRCGSPSSDHETTAELRESGLTTLMPYLRGDREVITLGWLGGQPRANTRRAYVRDFEQFLVWCDRVGLEPIGAKGRDLKPYRVWLETQYGRPATVSRKLATVSSWYRFATDEHEDLVPSNPMLKVGRPERDQESTTVALDRDELGRLFRAAERDGVWSEAFVKMLFYSGARVSEICTATTADLRRERGHRTLWVTRKGGGRIRLTVATPAADALDRHLAGRSGPLFLGRSREPLTRRGAARRLERLAHLASIPAITPHSLRHTAATLALDEGQDIREVQRFLGHSKIETTMRYDRSRASIDRSPTHALAAALEPRKNHNTTGEQT